MLKHVAIIGAGINGLLTAFLVRENFPDIHIDIYDAEQHPANAKEHKGVTYSSRDARHITGSESISFESSIHKNALRSSPENERPGWLLKKETDLTAREKQWRNAFEASYTGSGLLNDLDYAHAELNYKGLTGWLQLIKKYPFINSHVISDNGVEVYFTDKTSFEDDLVMETDFCSRYFKAGTLQAEQNKKFKALYPKKLVVPGISIRVQSLAIDLLTRLEKDSQVSFCWECTVKSGTEIEAQVIIWTAGVTHLEPEEYKEYQLEGIVGCWVTLPNQGYDKPFKIAAPAPSAYINFTPDGTKLHISGGFGWTGEHVNTPTISELAAPIAKHFIEQINSYLPSNTTMLDVNYCIRASTPSGQPLLTTKSIDDKTNIFIAGSAKSGTTHAPALSEYVISQIKNYPWG